MAIATDRENCTRLCPIVERARATESGRVSRVGSQLLMGQASNRVGVGLIDLDLTPTK